MDNYFRFAMLAGAACCVIYAVVQRYWPGFSLRLPTLGKPAVSTAAGRVEKWESLRAECVDAGCIDAVAGLDAVFPALAGKAVK